MMLKTSSDYVHGAADGRDAAAAFYGFKAQVVGYERTGYQAPTVFSTAELDEEDEEEEEGIETSLNSSEVEAEESRSSKEAMLQRTKALIGRFEGDLVYLYGLCVSTLVSCTSTNTIVSLANRLAAKKAAAAQKKTTDAQLSAVWQPKIHPDDVTDLDSDVAEEIYAENESILRKGLSFELGGGGGGEPSLTVQSLLNFSLPSAAVNAFLDDFIRLKPESSGSRLALWFQSESFISPGCCLLTALTSADLGLCCCLPCAAYLEGGSFLEGGTGSSNTRGQQGGSQLCSRCHYQLFVKTIPPLPMQKGGGGAVGCENICRNSRSSSSTAAAVATSEPPVCVGQRVYIKIVTRDQHEEIAYDPNACVAINVRFVAPFEEAAAVVAEEEDKVSSTAKSTQKSGAGSTPHQAHRKASSASEQLLELIAANPYQITVREKCRFHAISMMKPYEAYSFEELRFETHHSTVGNKQSSNGGIGIAKGGSKGSSQLTSCESVPVKSFDNGYYLASWTPSSTGCYRVELIVDGEAAPEPAATLLTVSDELELVCAEEEEEEEEGELDVEALDELHRYMDGLDLGGRLNPFVQITIPIGKEREVLERLKAEDTATLESWGFYADEHTTFGSGSGSAGKAAATVAGPSSSKSAASKLLRHRIRKFICHDSAGLRIRALPSLQSEQIGIVAVNGLLTIVDQHENDDGTWVRLSNESIQAYCSGGAGGVGGGNGGSSSSNSNNSNLTDSGAQKEGGNNSSHPHHPHHPHHHSPHHRDPFQAPPDNSSCFAADNNSSFKKSVSAESKNLKQSLTFTTMRTEAWTLQFNRHFNRTLLVPIDAEADASDLTVRSKTKVKLSSSRNRKRSMKICPIKTPHSHYPIQSPFGQRQLQQHKKKHQPAVAKQLKSKVKLRIPGWFQVVNCGPDGALIRNSPNLLEVSVIIGIIQPDALINGVQMVSNEFGRWIRMSQDCLLAHCGELMDSRQSSFFAATGAAEGDVDAWILAEGVNGVEYLRYASHMHVPVEGEKEEVVEVVEEVEEEEEEDESDEEEEEEPDIFRENPGAYGIPVRTSNSRYSLGSGAASAGDHHRLEAIDNCCTTAPSKRAISNR